MYALLTRPPVTIADPLDLHVLSLPLAFILSQDQTLHPVLFLYLFIYSKYHYRNTSPSAASKPHVNELVNACFQT